MFYLNNTNYNNKNVMKTNYEERKQNRLQAYRNLAEKNQQLSTITYDRAKSMASVIPFGQPILIGHHSENRDRRFRKTVKTGQS